MRLPIHPFPARMAPELALETLDSLPPKSTVLDPMAGSGTVLRQAAELGHTAVGFDLDPLAVLMSRVWTTPVSNQVVQNVLQDILADARSIRYDDLFIPWIDGDEETAHFIDYWFGEKQQEDLRRISLALNRFSFQNCSSNRSRAGDILRIALSRIIITKDAGASLARDVSHSRPHKTKTATNFDVIPAFERAVGVVLKRLTAELLMGKTTVRIGDARNLKRLEDHTVDCVLTSPPYLNALDYMRAHRLSLVWLGYSLHELRIVRAHSIGTERSLRKGPELSAIIGSFGDMEALPSRYVGIVRRYASDMLQTMREIARVLTKTGRVTFVVGNSCIRTIFIQNSEAIVNIAEVSGLKLLSRYDRALPLQNRYLPTPQDGMLGKRMRTETILSFGIA